MAGALRSHSICTEAAVGCSAFCMGLTARLTSLLHGTCPGCASHVVLTLASGCKRKPCCNTCNEQEGTQAEQAGHAFMR